jgi:hypothetical protein
MMNSLTKNSGLPAVPQFPSMIATGANTVANAAGEVTNSIANAAGDVTNGIFGAANGVADGITTAANNIADIATNVVKNTPLAAPLFNIGNSIKNNAKNLGTDALNILPGAVSSPITQSINAVPEPQSLWVTLPLIIGIGVLIITFILIVKFRNQINATIQNIWANIKTFFAGPVEPEIDVQEDNDTSNQSSSSKIVESILPGRKEVFNVADNHYTFADAEPLCKALGAELATYDQVKEAWNTGADWCNYGWVKGQAAVYPTQQSTFDKLQNEGTDDARMQCGQVGINGGYFDNPELRFGVNCYGAKPSESKNSAAHVMKNDGQPQTPEVLAFDKKVLKYRARSGEIVVNPFKQGAWSN